VTPLLEATGISKSFGGLLALDDVSFELREGEVLGLIGPNGAGKTTLFNVVNGVYKPDRGRVVFLGGDVTGWSPDRIVRAGLARTHQIVKPLQEMTVLENVMVGACFGRENLSLASARRVAREVLEEVALGDRAGARAKELTIASKKRLEVARALASRPRLLLLDEVLAGLNPTEIEWMVKLIRGIVARGISILVIEHLMQAVMSLSDRIVVLNLGRKIAEGRPEEVAGNHEVIDAYLGDPNILERLMEQE
jgi:branched-chain amino acid transport system ATP-binding protein